MDRTRASDSERERVADRLRDAAAEGRITVDELDERIAAAYAAVTRGDLDVLLDDLPVAREEPKLMEPRRERKSRLPWLPGRYTFEMRWRAPATRSAAMADLMEYVTPPMNRFGYDLVDRTPDRLVFERETFPMWAIAPAVFLFPFGLLALLLRNRERVAIELLERDGETLLYAHGVAPLAVRRAFVGLQP